MSKTEEPNQDRRAPLALWRAAQAFLTTLFNLFGAPEELAARHTLTFKQHALILPWLRAAEALMRRLLFIEAALVANEPPASSRQASSKHKSRARKLLGFDAEHPEAWRVTFRTLPGRSEAEGRGPFEQVTESVESRSTMDPGSPRCALRPGNVKGFRSAWPLAERMEALLRVCNDPALYAKRLARRLRKTSALVQRIATSWQDLRDLVGRQLYDALIEPLACAVLVFNSS